MCCAARRVGQKYGTRGDVFNIAGALYAATLFLGAACSAGPGPSPFPALSQVSYHRHLLRGQGGTDGFASASRALAPPLLVPNVFKAPACRYAVRLAIAPL